MDTRELVKAFAVLSALVGWAAWRSPNMKRGAGRRLIRYGLWFMASADADEVRTGFFRERFDDLKAEHSAKPIDFLDYERQIK